MKQLNPNKPRSMADAGVHHRRQLPLPLDPTAQEFRPATSSYVVYHSFQPPPPPPPPALPPPSISPTRALLLSSVPTHVSESAVRRELEVFGDVRAVQMERLLEGIVTVHFYDLREAKEALNNIQEQHMKQQRRLRQYFHRSYPPPPPPPARGLLCGRVIWAQFAFPLAAELPNRYNQGALITNLDSDVSTAVIRDIFLPFGDVKEIIEIPLKSNNQIFVEFYDTRDATKALSALNGKVINGKPALLEFNPHPHPPGGVNNRRIPPRELVQPPTPPSPSVPGSGSGSLKKNVKSSSSSSDEQCVAGDGNGGRNKPCYYRPKSDPRFLIKGGLFSSFKDSRTTVMIKNIPNKYSQKLLLNMLDNHCIQCNEGDNQPQPPACLSSYDFLYLPIDFANKCNVGYGFVNMTSPEATWRLYKAFNHQNWEVFNSKKICQLSYARLQGLEALKKHFNNSKFPCEVSEEEYLPVVFTPPRDGRTLTEPMPVAGITITSSSSSSSEAEVEVGSHDLTGTISSSSSSDNNNEENLLVEEDTNQTAAAATEISD